MTTKMKTIMLEPTLPGCSDPYQVVKLTNTIDYYIGEQLSKSQVQRIILDPHIKIIVRPRK